MAALVLQARFVSAQQLGPVSGGRGHLYRQANRSGEWHSGRRGRHPARGVGVEGGYDSNVFYNDTQRAGSAMLRVTPFLQSDEHSPQWRGPLGPVL